jgi:hypothetical protein
VSGTFLNPKAKIDVYKQTLATDGVRGLYRGYTPSVVGIIIYRGLYFGLYDSLSTLLTLWIFLVINESVLQSLLSWSALSRARSLPLSPLVGYPQRLLELLPIQWILSGMALFL